MKNMMHTTLAAMVAVLVAIPVAAREISANEARRAAAAWVRRDLTHPDSAPDRFHKLKAE